jgi:hypothetical protein
MVLYAYVLCLCILLDMILGDTPLISEVVLSQLISEQDWGKTHIKASKNRNNIFGDEHLCVLLCNYEISST